MGDNHDHGSDSDEFRIRRVTNFALRPADKPDNYAHIIDTESANEDKYGIIGQDGIVTILYKFDPELLKNFLDQSISRFSFDVRRPSSRDSIDLKITRQNDIVECGFYEMRRGRLYWDHGMRYRMDSSGSWQILSMLPTEDYPPPARPADADSFGESLVLSRRWELDDGNKVDVRYTKEEDDVSMEFSSSLSVKKKVSTTKASGAA